jgi:hypothetical protein
MLAAAQSNKHSSSSHWHHQTANGSDITQAQLCQQMHCLQSCSTNCTTPHAFVGNHYSSPYPPHRTVKPQPCPTVCVHCKQQHHHLHSAPAPLYRYSQHAAPRASNHSRHAGKPKTLRPGHTHAQPQSRKWGSGHTCLYSNRLLARPSVNSTKRKSALQTQQGYNGLE